MGWGSNLTRLWLLFANILHPVDFLFVLNLLYHFLLDRFFLWSWHSRFTYLFDNTFHSSLEFFVFLLVCLFFCSLLFFTSPFSEFFLLSFFKFHDVVCCSRYFLTFVVIHFPDIFVELLLNVCEQVDCLFSLDITLRIEFSSVNIKDDISQVSKSCVKIKRLFCSFLGCGTLGLLEVSHKRLPFKFI